MEKLLTIVVPAYNVEKYIKNCLDSLIEISVLRSLEILVVNDVSKVVNQPCGALAAEQAAQGPCSFQNQELHADSGKRP